MKSIIVTTEHRGVFFGQVPDEQDLDAKTMGLDSARCAIYWGTTGGIGQLAATGPTDKSRIGDSADIRALHDITAVWECTPAAAERWLEV